MAQFTNDMEMAIGRNPHKIYKGQANNFLFVRVDCPDALGKDILIYPLDESGKLNLNNYYTACGGRPDLSPVFLGEDVLKAAYGFLEG